MKAKAAAAAAAANQGTESTPTPSNTETEAPKFREIKEVESESSGFYGAVKEEYIKQPFKNPEGALKEAMNNLGQDEW